MKKKKSPADTGKTHEVEPFDPRKVDWSGFKSDLTALEFRDSLTTVNLGTRFPIFWNTIETLSATRTVGKGRTNLTLINATILQTDATSPYAGFDRTVTPNRNPVSQIHFEPSAYGITGTGTYYIAFTIDAGASATFSIQGYAGPGTVVNAGSRTVSGRKVLTLILKNVPANQQVYAFIEQTAGNAWSWYATEIQFPPLVIHL